MTKQTIDKAHSLNLDPLAATSRLMNSFKRLPADSDQVRTVEALLRLYSLKTVAELLECSELFLRKRIKKGDGPEVTYLGKAMRVRAVHLLEWLDRQRRSA
jgi:hypothetical protein